MSELNFYRILHSLLAVARVAAECRQAVNLMARAAAESGNTPYTVDELDSAAVDCLSALAETLRALERTSVPVGRARKRGLLGTPPEDVSRETSPDTDRTPGSDEGYPF